MGWTRYFYVAAALAAVAPVSAQGLSGAPGSPGGATPAAAPGVGSAPGGSGPRDVAGRDANSELERVNQELQKLKRHKEALSREYTDALTRYGAGNTEVVARQRQLEAVEQELQQAEAEFNDRSKALMIGYSNKSRILLQPVAVELKNASVRQAATALSRATQVPIDIQGDVPDELRLTVQARGVSLGAVLQAIAKQANLKITPADSGIVMTPWPMVLVNDQLQVFRGAWAPWSSEWGILPGYQTSDGWDFPGEAEPLRAGVNFYAPEATPGGGRLTVPNTIRTTPLVPGMVPLSEGYPRAVLGTPLSMADSGGGRSNRSVTSSAAMGISVAALGERTIAVSEPGRGAEGQFGAWITVYRIDGALLKKVAAGFHPLHSTTPGRNDGSGTMPGGGMNPLGGLGAPGVPGGAPVVPGGSLGTFGAPGGLSTAPLPTPLTTVPAAPGGGATPVPSPAPVSIRTVRPKKVVPASKSK